VEPDKPVSSYRHYPADAVTKIRIIKRAQQAGFSLSSMFKVLNFLHSDAYKIIQRHDIARKLSVPVGLNLCQSYACWKALTEKHRQQVQPTL
jgi:DNA-binding transcriptional MerR regulator